jgi:hypothetical protein
VNTDWSFQTGKTVLTKGLTVNGSRGEGLSYKRSP